MTMLKPVLLVVSFGVCSNEARTNDIQSIEEAVSRAFPDYEIRRAFTSRTIIDRIREDEGIAVDTVREALDRLVNEGVREVVIQPTHILPGFEYDELKKTASLYAGRFDRLAIGKTLLDSESDYDEMQRIIADAAKEYSDADTAVVLMGHGTEHSANAGYAKLQRRINAAGHNNIFIGTLEAMPTVHYVRALIRLGDFKRVVLMPFMIAAGEDAVAQMTGEAEDSWRSIFKDEGFEVECVLKGLGGNADVRRMMVRHCGETIVG